MSPSNVAQVIADLRRTHAQLKANQVDNRDAPAHRWSMRLTLEEVDVLLAIVDERDQLRRDLCDMPDEVRERGAIGDQYVALIDDALGREEREAPPVRGVVTSFDVTLDEPPLTPTAAYFAGERPALLAALAASLPPVSRKFTTEHGTCRYCEGELVRYGSGMWQHIATNAGGHPATPDNEA